MTRLNLPSAGGAVLGAVVALIVYRTTVHLFRYETA